MTQRLRPEVVRALQGLFEDTVRKVPPALPEVPGLLEFVTSNEWCWTNAKSTPSKMQRAIVMAAAGDEVSCATTGFTEAEMHFHFATQCLPAGPRPATVVGNAGVRSGKSLLAAMCALIYGAITADLSNVRPGERVRGLIVAPRVELSLSTFAHVVGTLQASPNLRAYLDGTPNAESLWIKRPDGHRVLIQIVAAAPGGVNLRSTWLIGIVFDEADFHDSEDAAVNLAENREAATMRLVPGAQEWVVSSPWIDSGPFYDLVQRYLGKPDDGIVCFHSNSRAMNPTLDPVREAQMRRRDPDKASRELDAIPMTGGGDDFFPASLIDACMVDAPPWAKGTPHFGGTDLGFRKNSSALALSHAATIDGRMRAVLGFVRELRPEKGKPLVPGEVVKTFARDCYDHDCSSMKGDLHYADTAQEKLAEIANDASDGIRIAVSYDEHIPTQESNAAVLTELRRRMLEAQAILGTDPVLRQQLKGTKSKALPGGKIVVILPKRGQLHGDVLMAAALSLTQVPLHEPATGGIDGTGIYVGEGSRYDDMAF